MKTEPVQVSNMIKF